jgi:hypothetical protein
MEPRNPTYRYRSLEDRMSDDKKKPDGLQDHDKHQDDLQDGDSGRELPEGLERERKGPLNKSTGRRTEPRQVRQERGY